MPLRSPKMNCFIFGFQRRVWCPKWTPASSRSLIETLAATAITSGATVETAVVSDNSRPPSYQPDAGSDWLRAFRPQESGLVFRSSTLAELEPGAGALLSVLLALLDARVARQEAGLLELDAQLGVVLAERSRDRVSDGARLGGHAAAVDRGYDVELVVRLRHRERLLDDLLQGLDASEVVVEPARVELELAR